MQITATTPAQNAVNVGLLSVVSVEFDLNINPDSITQASITVATKKNNIISSINTGDSVNIFDNEDFFDAEFTAISKGTVAIDVNNPKKLNFTPDFRFLPNTEYVVYISKTIAGSDDSILNTIYSITFKTHSEDIIEPLPVVTGSTIIGKDVLPENSTGTSGLVSLSKTIPVDNSIMVSGDTIIFDFALAIEKPVSSDILITKSNIFSDDTSILSVFTVYHELSGKRIRIKLPQQFEENCFYSVQLYNVNIPNNTSTNEFSLGFISKLNPYYSSIKLLRLKSGSMINSLTDLHLASMIHFVSQEADVMLTKIKSHSKYDYLRSRWVLYSVVQKLLLNSFDQNSVDSFKKSFGEYNISISNGSRVKAFNSLLEESRQWLQNFTQMLNFVYSQSTFVKGKNIPSAIEGRLWDRGIQPGLNQRANKKLQWDEIGVPIPWNVAIRQESTAGDPDD